MRIDIYADIVCPWCYIGKRRIESALAAFPRAHEVDVVYRPYQLDSNAATTPIPLTEYLEKRFGPGARERLAPVSAAANAEGLPIMWETALSVNTKMAHRLLALAAREYGANVQHALIGRLFEMHFTRGGNIGDAMQLSEEAAAVGIDGNRARTYLSSREGLSELDTELALARANGIRAVPTFVFNRKRVVEGAQSTEVLLHALTLATDTPNP